MIQQFKNISQNRYKNHLAPAFLIVEALVAALVSAILLTGAIKIIEQQNIIHSKTVALQKIHNAVALDSKAIRHYATMWNSVNLDYENLDEYPNGIDYSSAPSICIGFQRRNIMETAFRSDSFNYNKIFPFAPTIQQSNVVIARIPDNLGNTYRVIRTYINTGNTTNLETDPFTIRVKYTTDVVNSENVVTPLPLEHTMDVNLVAQYSC